MHDICHDSFCISTALVLHRLVKFQNCLVQVLKVSLPIPQTLTNCFLGSLNLAHSAEFQAAHVLLAIQLCVAYGFAKAAGGTIAAAASIAMGIQRLMHATSIWHHVYYCLCLWPPQCL